MRALPRLFLMLVSLGLAASAASAADLDLNSVPPNDPAILTGVLPNGMTYFVRPNPKPEKHVELRLAVKVGSVQETDAEQGLAHFNEHMQFNGSKNFPPGEVVSYLESIGARFGADSNAYTSFDETVYMLTIPTDKDGALEKGLLIMQDWAGAATLSAAEIEKERGVVNDELRGSKGARKRIRDKQNQLVFQGSRYADRMPIGQESVIMGAPPETLQGFYKKWYRPDVMAIIAVGDFDGPTMEKRIKELFSAVPASDTKTVVPPWPVPSHGDTLYSVESDKELTSSNVQVYYKHETKPERTIGDSRRALIKGLASGLLSMRLSERANQPDPPFLGAGAGAFDYVLPLEIFSVSASAKDGEIPKATTALLDELERAKRDGFLQAELDRVKTAIGAQAERRLKESPERRSGERVDSIVQTFLEDEPNPSDQLTHDVIVGLLPGIALDEVNVALRSLASSTSRVVLVQVPEKAGVAIPTVAEMKAIVEPAQAREVAAYVDDLAGKQLVTEADTPAGGKVASRASIPAIGFEDVVLSNGVRVLWKMTDFRADQILFSGFAQGGAADEGKAEFVSALRGDTYAVESGLADFTSPQLAKWMTGSGKIAGASPSINRFSRTFSGSARPADVELMLQLTWLYFTKPAFRADAFTRMVDSEVQSLKNQLNSPGGMYGRAVDEVAFDGHWLYRTPEVAEIQGLEPAKLEKFYRQAFDDGSEWTFVLVGNFDEATHLPLIEKWLGSLPTTSATPRTSDPDKRYAGMNLHFPKGKTVREVKKGIEDQSRTAFMMDCPHRLDPQARFDIDAVTDLLDIRLRDKLREEMGDTYGASVYYTQLPPYRDYGRINVSFTGSPATQAEMMTATKEAIRWMRMTMPTESDASKLREMRTNELDVAEKENGYWLGGVQSALVEGRDPRSILDNRRRIAGITPRSLWASSKKWLDMSDSAEVRLMPETWVPGAKKAEPAMASGTASGQ